MVSFIIHDVARACADADATLCKHCVQLLVPGQGPFKQKGGGGGGGSLQ